MRVRFIRLGLLVAGWLIVLGSCAHNEAVTAYTGYITAVHTLIREHKQNTDLAAKEVLAYVQEHQAEIKTALSALEVLGDKEKDQFYNQVMQPVRALKQTLAAEVITYPDSVRDQILEVLEQNRTALDAQAAAAAAVHHANIIQENFALFTTELGVIKELSRKIPLKNYHLQRSKEFLSALEILKIDNLVWTE